MAATFRRGLLPKVHYFLGQVSAQSRLSRPAKLAGHRAAPSVTPEWCPKSGRLRVAAQSFCLATGFQGSICLLGPLRAKEIIELVHQPV
jgi:hypothetical protein